MNSVSTAVLPLVTADASLDQVGGKGRSLAKLAAAGMPVPAGFLLSTTAYKGFLQANRLQEAILEAVSQVELGNSLETAEARIRSLFQAANIPVELAAEITLAYGALSSDSQAVAVRSSATAEDLPDLSFAGQQDTYLNVSGEAALLEAVRGCWASLWTARAIAYRQQMEVDQRGVAMGVVIQVMVPAEVAGILFTANPASGDRSELVVNASFGLGEAVVAGHVTPDTYVVDRTSLEIKNRLVGAKEQMIVPDGDAGTTTLAVPVANRDESSLSTESLKQLAKLSVEAEQLFGFPQDIEWAVADGKCWLLQSRPITNLPAAPLKDVTWDPPQKGVKLVRRQVVENMPDPLSPLFDELYLQVGLERALDRMVDVFQLPFKIESLIDRPFFVTLNGYAYCRASYKPARQLIPLMPRVVWWYATSLRRLLRMVIPHWRDVGLPEYLRSVDNWRKIEPTSASDEQLLSGIRALATADANYWFDLAIVLGGAKVTDGALNWFLTSRFVPGDLTSGTFLRGFPSKVLQAQQELEAIANTIRDNAALRTLVVETPARDLLPVLRSSSQANSLVEQIDRHLAEYGHQVYTLDFVEPTQVEDPLPVLLNLKSLTETTSYDTQARQAELAAERDAQIRETSASLGPIRRRLFRMLLRWAQSYGPYREEALFYMGAAWPTLRRLALELGDRLVRVGTLTRADDVFFLKSQELEAACTARNEAGALPTMVQLAADRRALREARKKLHPPGMLPVEGKLTIGPIDLSAFETQKRNAANSTTLNGFPVSPGKVTGRASVILSPYDFEKMEPDTILVCPTTTPAWTPLFPQAIGLVTDIGGILAHGSIVAREYGIPAVMGTGNVTQRVVSGQLITVDGDAGEVVLEVRSEK